MCRELTILRQYGYPQGQSGFGGSITCVRRRSEGGYYASKIYFGGSPFQERIATAILLVDTTLTKGSFLIGEVDTGLSGKLDARQYSPSLRGPTSRRAPSTQTMMINGDVHRVPPPSYEKGPRSGLDALHKREYQSGCAPRADVIR